VSLPDSRGRPGGGHGLTRTAAGPGTPVEETQIGVSSQDPTSVYQPRLWERMGHAAIGLSLMTPALLALIVFFVVPLILVFGKSFTEEVPKRATLITGGSGSIAAIHVEQPDNLRLGTWTITTDAAGAASAAFTSPGAKSVEATVSGTISAGATNGVLIPGLKLTAAPTLRSGTNAVTITSGTAFTFDNYRQLWESVAFRRIIRMTFEIALYTTIACLLLGYAFAYKLSLMPRARANFFLLLCLVPFWTAILARLYAWTILLGRRGIINDWFQKTGLIDRPLDLLFSRDAVIIGMVHVMLPYMILVMYSTMISIDRTLLDAAKSLGASGFETFRRVFLPLTMPGVYAGSVLVFIISLGFFITPAVLGGGKVTTISMFIQDKVRISDWGVATAMGAVLLAITLALFFVFNRLFGTERLITGRSGNRWA
jgi:putative spermidine/putrescine transport system permease protein